MLITDVKPSGDPRDYSLLDLGPTSALEAHIAVLAEIQRGEIKEPDLTKIRSTEKILQSIKESDRKITGLAERVSDVQDRFDELSPASSNAALLARLAIHLGQLKNGLESAQKDRRQQVESLAEILFLEPKVMAPTSTSTSEERTILSQDEILMTDDEPETEISDLPASAPESGNDETATTDDGLQLRDADSEGTAESPGSNVEPEPEN